MSKLLYMLTGFMMVFSVNAYAEEECSEGKVLDPELKICVDAPEETPEEIPEG